MKHYGFAAVVAVIALAAFTTTPATAQYGDCIVTCHVYYNSDYSGGACRGTGGVCFSCYIVCDGQPFPIQYQVEPSHPIGPQTQAALLDGAELSSDTPLQTQMVMETKTAEAPMSCETQSLFGRLDRRQKPNLFAEKPKMVASAAITVLALP